MAPITDKFGLSCFRNRSREIPSPTHQPTPRRSSTVGKPTLSASSSNNHSLFSFGQHAPRSEDLERPDAVEPNSVPTQSAFLPEVSFDDFQTSIEASDALKLTQFPSPPGESSILASQGLSNPIMVDGTNPYRTGAAARVPVHQSQQLEQQQQQSQTGQTRAGAVFRPSITSGTKRQASISSTTSNMSRVSDAPQNQTTLRPKRQNQHPPVSHSIIRPPAKTGTEPGNGSTVRRRPSVGSSDQPQPRGHATRASIDNYTDTSRNMTASRAAKLKTLSQPPPSRINTATASADNSSLSVEQQRASASAPRSPRTVKSRATTPSGTSGKRISALPQHTSGLGARTVSPTDAQRLKRRSLMPDPQTVQETLNNSIALQPPPPSAADRPASRSPSMLPRKTSTPSSLRTTPDPNRKSYNSGFSVGSLTSSNTVRTSTGSLQPRQPQNTGSRLPAPKSMNSIPASTEEDEDVPPVPAIPKVYESPKESPADMQFLDKRKSNLALDSSSMRSTSTGSLPGPVQAIQEKARAVQRRNSARKPVPTAAASPEKRAHPEQSQPVQPRRNFKSMNLPPLTVGPLSTPTVNKIAKLQIDQGQAARHPSSPPPRRITKTPTTPMTASRSSFFPKRKDLPTNRYRSSSSVHQPQHESPLLAETSSSESADDSNKQLSVSPFLSSSVPKEDGFEQRYFKRSQTGNEIRDSEEGTSATVAQSKPSGPRAQRQPSTAMPNDTVSKVFTKSTPKSPVQQPSPDEPQTPSSMSSLRRKLSLSWKRSSSKTEKHPENSNTTRHDAMPAPRMPTSVTTGNSIATKTSSPSVVSASKFNALADPRRKPSGSDLHGPVSKHGRNRSDASLGTSVANATTRAIKGGNADSSNRSTASSTSVMQKFLRSKASTAKMQPVEPFTADLDKDDLVAEEEMRKLGSRRKETELAAKTLDTLQKRATQKERVSPQDAIRIAMLNIYERGEIVDYKDIYFCGTQNAQKVVGDLNSKSPNFGYDDERGDYSIVVGDHLSYRYEIVDILGKGSFGQVVRCIDHKTGVLVAVKIIRNKKRFHQQALVEVNILQKLREWVSAI